MSRRNGNRAKFHIDQKRKLRHRQRVRELFGAAGRPQAAAAPSSDRGGAEPRK